MRAVHRLLLVGATLVVVVGCAGDQPRTADRNGLRVESYLEVVPRHLDEVDYWRTYCAAQGDPVEDVVPPSPTTPPGAVAFIPPKDSLGLPESVYAAAVSAGRLGDRPALLLAGRADKPDSSGTPFLGMYVRCAESHHRIGLPETDEGLPTTIGASGLWDANGDGRTDLLFAGADGTGPAVWLVLNGGEGTFGEPTVVWRGAEHEVVSALTPIDINRDGVLDLYVSVALDTRARRVDVASSDANDRIILFDSDGRAVDISEERTDLSWIARGNTAGLTCVPGPPGRQRRTCMLGTTFLRDAILEETAELDYRVITGQELPENATAGIAAVLGSNGDATFIASNIGRPLALRVSEGAVSNVSHEMPMGVLDPSASPRHDADRPRIGWGVTAQHFGNSGCAGVVVANGLTAALAFLPIWGGSGLSYYERDCSQKTPDGTTFVNRSKQAGPNFRDRLNDNAQATVTFNDGDLCPDLALATFRAEPEELLQEPAPVELVLNACATAGRRLAVQLVPTDYDARVVVTLDDGTERHGVVAPPGPTGSHDPIVSIGLGDRKAERICVHWGENSRWPQTEPDCIETPATDRFLTISRTK